MYNTTGQIPAPGVELDVRVALEVLGHKWIPYPPRPTMLYLFDLMHQCQGDDHRNIGKNRMIDWSMPAYSKDIGAAWFVLTSLIQQKQGIYPEVIVRVHDNKLQHHCDIWYNDPAKGKYGWLCQAYGYTAPHAICLAALETVKHPLWMQA